MSPLDWFKKQKPMLSMQSMGGGAAGYMISAEVASTLTVPTGVSGPGQWDLSSQGALTLNIGNTYDIGVSDTGATISVVIHMWGAGGSGGRAAPTSYTTFAGGGGGYTTGTMSLTQGTTYKAVVGNAKGNNPESTPWGDPAASGNPISPPYNGPNPWVPSGYYKMSSGGYSGIFATSVSAPNARLMAAGGGSGGYNDEGVQGAGGGGGGGSAYIHPSITGGSTTAAAIQDAANDSSPYYVSGRAKGGVFSGTDPTMTHPGWPNTMWGAPGTITFVLSD